MTATIKDEVYAIFHPSKDRYWDGTTFVKELGMARLYDLKDGATVVMEGKGRLDGAIIVAVQLIVKKDHVARMRKGVSVHDVKRERLAAAAAGGEG